VGARKRSTLPHDYYERVARAPVRDSDGARAGSEARDASSPKGALPADYFESLARGAKARDDESTERGSRAAAETPDRVTTTIRLSGSLRDRARDSAPSRHHPGGKSLSALVEHLLAREIEKYAQLTPPAEP